MGWTFSPKDNNFRISFRFSQSHYAVYHGTLLVTLEGHVVRREQVDRSRANHKDPQNLRCPSCKISLII